MGWIRTHTTAKGEQRYTAVVRRKGHPVRAATFGRKTDARAWISRTESALLEGRHLPTNEAQRQTFSSLVERYVRDVLPDRPPAERRKRETQLRWWADRLGRYTLAAITPALIAEGRDALAAGETPSGKPASPATCVRYLAALSHAFTVAVKEWGWLTDNPARRVRRPTEPRGRVRFLSDDERHRLLDACRASQEHRLYPLVMLALATGARQGELLQLRWRDVDLRSGVAVVHQTKNSERRALPLGPPARAALRQLPRRIGTDYVFAGRSGSPTYPRKAFLRAVEAAGLENFRFHDLRHSAASYLAMSGATLAEIAEILGHKTLAMVRRYAHIGEQHSAAVVERMNARFLAE